MGRGALSKGGKVSRGKLYTPMERFDIIWCIARHGQGEIQKAKGRGTFVKFQRVA